MSSRHEILQQFLGAYVLGAVDGARRRQIDAHLEECAACTTEARDLEEARALLPQPPEPSPELWQRIVEEVRHHNEAQDEATG